MPLIIHGLGGGHTHTMHTRILTSRTKAISRNHARAYGRRAPGLKYAINKLFYVIQVV